MHKSESLCSNAISHICNKNKIKFVLVQVSLNHHPPYIKSWDNGVNLMSFDRNIQKSDASAQSATPPHPKSKLHEV